MRSLVARVVAIAALLWLVLTSVGYRYSNPDQTETELFLNLPYAVTLQWDSQ